MQHSRKYCRLRRLVLGVAGVAPRQLRCQKSVENVFKCAAISPMVAVIVKARGAEEVQRLFSTTATVTHFMGIRGEEAVLVASWRPLHISQIRADVAMSHENTVSLLIIYTLRDSCRIESVVLYFTIIYLRCTDICSKKAFSS
jgi:hypothetical protein